jgi:hypothetical protein
MSSFPTDLIVSMRFVATASYNKANRTTNGYRRETPHVMQAEQYAESLRHEPKGQRASRTR